MKQIANRFFFLGCVGENAHLVCCSWWIQYQFWPLRNDFRAYLILLLFLVSRKIDEKRIQQFFIIHDLPKCVRIEHWVLAPLRYRPANRANERFPNSRVRSLSLHRPSKYTLSVPFGSMDFRMYACMLARLCVHLCVRICVFVHSFVSQSRAYRIPWIVCDV